MFRALELAVKRVSATAFPVVRHLASWTVPALSNGLSVAIPRAARVNYGVSFRQLTVFTSSRAAAAAAEPAAEPVAAEIASTVGKRFILS